MVSHGFPIKIAAAGGPIRSNPHDFVWRMSRQEDGDAAAAPVGVRNAASLNLTKAS